MTTARDWGQTRHRIHERWPGLPEEDIEASQGDRTALIALLQGRLGYARPNAEQDLDEILAGEVIVPEDVADERVHTGTSGPVAPRSESLNPGEATHRPLNGGRAERTQQAPDEGSPYSTRSQPDAPQTAQPGMPDEPPMHQGMRGSGPPSGGDGPWDGGSWGANHSHGMRSGPPKLVVAIVGLGAVLVVGMLIGRRKRKQQSKAEQVTEQARHLLEEITERMPSVEELREKVRSLDEAREKKMAASRR